MLVAELIRRKSDGGELSAGEIHELVAGITDGTVTDAQVGRGDGDRLAWDEQWRSGSR